MNVAWTTLRPRLLYGGFALLAFAFALRWTFPAEAIKERLIYEAGARGWQIDVERVGPGTLLGVRLVGVSLADASGVKLPIDRLDASLQLLPLLTGKRTLAFDADFLDGTVSGSADLSGASRRAQVELAGLDLARALPLRQAAGRDLAGKVSGNLDLTLPGGALDKASGLVGLQIAGAAAGAGGVAIPGMSGNLPLPAVSLGAVEASAKVEQGRALFDRLEAKGGDVELAVEGALVVLQARLEHAPISGRARLRFAPSLWQKPQAAPLKPLAEAALASSRAPDGAYQLQLAGSLGHPQLRSGSGAGAAPPPPPPRPAPPAPAPAPPPPASLPQGGDE